MIHVIPHHINRGSWPPWHELIYFNETTNILSGTEVEKIERNLLNISPPSILLQYLDNLHISNNDCVFLDSKYFDNQTSFEFFKNSVIEISRKYNCKFFIIDDDNTFEYHDCHEFTYFSNRFNILDSKNNFNYFRYRTSNDKWMQHISDLIKPFLNNIRQKKYNFIIGVDKIERLLSLKHIYNTKLNLDGYIGYSAFTKNYSDESISDSLINFRNTTLPIILDISHERSLVGDVNVEYPPIPICLNSYVSCICETSIIESNQIHLSEKSWNPFISHNIPLILGSSKLLTYLKDLGFWLADDLFDTTPKEKTNDIINQYKSNLDIINNMSYESLHDYFVKNSYNLTKNFDTLIKQKFIFDRKNYK